MKLQTIPISSIRFDDEIFSITPVAIEKAPNKIVESVRRVGILHPPIVVEIADGIYRIGSGRKRLLAAQELQITTCQCHVFDTKAHPLDIFNYIYEEGSHTDLPLITKAIFLQKAGQWLSSEELARKFMQGFGLKENSYHVQKLQQLTKLELNIQEALLRSKIDEKVCHELVKLEFIDRMSLFDIIKKLSLSIGNQRKLLISCRELATRMGITIADFLGNKELTSILGNQTFNTPQMSSTFMAKLEQLRFPLLTKAEHKFQTFVKSLSLEKNMSLNHSPSFEKDDYILTIKCTNKNNLICTINKIKEAKH